MERKVKDFLRKVSNRKKSDKLHPNAEQKAAPSSTRRELKPLPKIPVSQQKHELNPPLVERNPSPLLQPVDQNSELLLNPVESKRESLSRSYHQNPQVVLPSTSPDKLPESAPPARQPSDPVSQPLGRTMSESSRKVRTERWARNSDPRSSEDSFPGLLGDEQSRAVADSVAYDYAAYQPMLSPGTSIPNESQFTTLGGDTRLMTNASTLRHNEDIANRNIEANSSGQGSGVNSLTETENKIMMRGAARKESSGQSSGSLGGNSLGGGSAGGGSITDSIGGGPPSSSIDQSVRSFVYSNRANWPVRVARDEPHYGKRKGTGNNNSVSQASSKRDFGSRHNSRKPDGQLMDPQAAIMDGTQADRKHENASDQIASDLKEKLHLQGMDLDDGVEVDKTTRWAPAVTHETIKPIEHHIREEQIHREIHTHEVYHRIQPVHETVVLPARHFVPSTKGNGLIEVSEDMLPDCTGANQRWFIGEKEMNPHTTRKPLPQLSEPNVTDETTTIAPEGFPRKETTIVHPPELEDMSGYGGPVRTIHFPTGYAPDEESGYDKDVLNYVPDVVPYTLKELTRSTSKGLPSPPDSTASKSSLSPPESPMHRKIVPPSKPRSMLEV